MVHMQVKYIDNYMEWLWVRLWGEIPHRVSTCNNYRSPIHSDCNSFLRVHTQQTNLIMMMNTAADLLHTDFNFKTNLSKWG